MSKSRPRFCYFFTLLITLFSLSSLNSNAATVSAKTFQVVNKPMMQSLEFSQDIRQAKPGDTVLMPLTDRELTEFKINSSKATIDGGTVINASSKSGTQLLLSSDEQATYGSITGNGMNYTVSSDPQLGTVMVDRNHSEFPVIDLGNDGILPPGVSPDIPGIEQITPQQKALLNRTRRNKTAQVTSNGSTIRMLILYSNEFAAGFSSPTARINQLLQFTNQSMQNSNIDLEFTLARAQVLNFNNSLNTSTTLTQIQAGSGAFAGVASLRDEVGADMVAVLSFQQGFSANGIAFVNSSANPNFAFSSTRLSPGCCDSVFAHELGHNLGSGHERSSVNPSASSPCTGGGFTKYSCGHGNRNANNGNGWGTIMARLNSQVVNDVFSNPNLTCLGEPCGVPEGLANQADNFRSFNMSRLLMAEFRPDPTPPPPTPGPGPSNSGTIIAPVISILLDDE